MKMNDEKWFFPSVAHATLNLATGMPRYKLCTKYWIKYQNCFYTYQNCIEYIVDTAGESCGWHQS